MSVRKDDAAEMEQMRAWVRHAAQTLNIAPEDYDPLEAPLLALTRAVAHGASRPGAPLTNYLAGLAAGRGADAATVIEQLTALANSYDEEPAQ